MNGNVIILFLVIVLCEVCVFLLGFKKGENDALKFASEEIERICKRNNLDFKEEYEKSRLEIIREGLEECTGRKMTHT